MRVQVARLVIALLAVSSFFACGKSSVHTTTNPTLSSISVSGSSASLDLTKTEQFTATGHYSDGSTQDLTSTVTWSSATASVASISSSGSATALAAGTTKITATSGSVTGSTTLTVNGPVSIAVTSNQTSSTVNVGAVVQLTAKGTFSDNTTIDLTNVVTWTASPSTVASVTKAGSVTCAAVGVATIVATAGTVSGSIAVSITSQNGGPGSLGPSYAFFLETIDSRGQAVIAGSFTTDGNGNITGGMADYNMASGVSSTGAVSLTASKYTVLPDGRGEADITFNGQTFHVAFVLFDFVGGVAQKGRMISYDSHIASGEFELQTAGANLAANTDYVFGFNGLDSTNQSAAEIGLLNTNPSAKSYYDVDDNGNVDGASNPPPSTAQVFSSVTIGAVGAGNRGTAKLVNTLLGTANYAYYTTDGSKAYFIETDAVSGSTALAGIAEQVTADLTASLLSPESTVSPCNSTGATCDYAYLLNHTASATNGTFERGGQYNFCNCNVSGGINHANEDDSDGSFWTITSGSRDFGGGRGVFNYKVANSTASGQPRYAIIYEVSQTDASTTAGSSSRLYIMNTDSNTPGIGTVDFIDVGLGTGSRAPVPGTYVFSAGNIGKTNLLQLGLVTLDSSGNASGIGYINSNGTLSTDVPMGGAFTASTDTAGDNGRGTISPFDGASSSLVTYDVGSKGLVVFDTSTQISGRFEPQ